MPSKVMGEPQHQCPPLPDGGVVEVAAVKANTIILNGQAQLGIDRLKPHTNTTNATIWKRMLHRIGHKLIEDQTQEHGLLHAQWSAVGFALDHDWPAVRDPFEIVAQLANISRAVQGYVLIARPEASMHACHDLHLLDRLIQAPPGF